MTNLADPIVSIVIPAWGTGKKVIEQLNRSILAINETVRNENEIIVISNTEDKAYRQAIQENQLVARWATVSQNVGVARGWNIGAQLALGKYLCIMNQDVVVGANCIDSMIDILENNPDVGIIGPEGGYWSFTSTEPTPVKRARPQSGMIETHDVSGFLFIVPATIYDQSGGFGREYYPCWYEDIDFSFRVRRLGFRSIAVGGLKYEHPWGVSTSNVWTSVSYFGRKELLRNIRDRNRNIFFENWRQKYTELDAPVNRVEVASSYSTKAFSRFRRYANDLRSLVKLVVGRRK